MQREKWLLDNKVLDVIMGIVREAYNTGYLEGKRDGSPIYLNPGEHILKSDVNEIDLERRRAECQ